MKINTRLLVLFLAITLSSCTPSHTVDSVQSVNDTNKTITVAAPPEINTFQLNDFLSLVVLNNSDHEVLLFPESTIEITMMNDGQSTSIRNSLNSSNRQIRLSPKSQKETNQTLFSVIPDIQAQEKVTVRITVKGTDQATNQEVSAYVDLTLTP